MIDQYHPLTLSDRTERDSVNIWLWKLSNRRTCRPVNDDMWITTKGGWCVSEPAVPSGYSEISNIAVDKPGRRLYNIRGPMLQEAVSVLLQIDAADGNKVITVRSPLQVWLTNTHKPQHTFLWQREPTARWLLSHCLCFQIKNHFSVPFTIMKYCPASRSLQSVGQAEPEREFHIALETYR